MKKLMLLVAVAMLAGCGDPDYVEEIPSANPSRTNSDGTISPILYGNYSSSKGKFYSDGTPFTDSMAPLGSVKP